MVDTITLGRETRRVRGAVSSVSCSPLLRRLQLSKAGSKGHSLRLLPTDTPTDGRNHTCSNDRGTLLSLLRAVQGCLPTPPHSSSSATAPRNRQTRGSRAITSTPFSSARGYKIVHLSACRLVRETRTPGPLYRGVSFRRSGPGPPISGSLASEIRFLLWNRWGRFLSPEKWAG